MRVLVTGGTGLVGTATVRALLERGHIVRLLARHAVEDARRWFAGVEPRDGDVAGPGTLRGLASECDALLHLVALHSDDAPQAALQRVNLDGTRRVLTECARAGVPRIVFVSCLGAVRGTTPYHASKRGGESLACAYPGAWLICRPGIVYGPGDRGISALLTMLRTLPVVPRVTSDKQPLQPIWVEDLAAALARLVEPTAPAATVLNLVGPDTTSIDQLLDELERLTGRAPPRVPLPAWLVSAGLALADAVGIERPLARETLAMLDEGAVLPPGEANALPDLLDAAPTPLSEGLRRLADAMPEQLPITGWGAMHRRRYWADIEGSPLTPEELLTLVCHEWASLLPEASMDVPGEPGSPVQLAPGITITIRTPLRGNVQVRVEEVLPRALTMVTLEGHFLAGAVRCLAEERGPALRFEIQTFDRAGTLPDLIALATIGRFIKHGSWGKVIASVVARSGGAAPEDVQRSDNAMDQGEANQVQFWLEELVVRRERTEAAGA